MKRLFILTCSLLTAILVSCGKPENKGKPAIEFTFNTATARVDNGAKPMSAKTGIEITKDMKTGWNLGNTLDAIGAKGLRSEMSWGQPRTTKAMIDGLAKSGFKTIRIPVSYSNHLIDNNYTVDPEWIKRVKEITDWAIANDMYVILNDHHDNFDRNDIMPYGGGYYPTVQNEEESLKFLRNVWGQITLAFNNGYDEHLVFETLNEPRLRGTNVEWVYNSSNPLCVEAATEINKFNQEIVNVIRASGGNNAKRLIMVPANTCSLEAAFSKEFVIPEDPANNIGVTVHMYTPYSFAMDPNGSGEYNQKMASDLSYHFKRLESEFVKKGIPVYIGEYGANNKDNLEDRVQWFHTFIRQTHVKGIPCMLWDNQAPYKDKNGYEEKYGFYNRSQQTWFFPEITETIMKACED